MSSTQNRKQSLLTHRAVEAAGPRLKRNPSDPDDHAFEYILFDGNGLCLVVRLTKDRKGVTKAWEYRYKSDITGKTEKIRLGAYPALSIKQARELADKHRHNRALGADPKAVIAQQKKEQALEEVRQGATFGNLAAEYIEENRARWSEGVTRRMLGKLKNHILPKRFEGVRFGDKPIHHIQYMEVARIVKECARVSPGVVYRVRRLIAHVFEHAVEQGALPARDNFMATSPNIGGKHKRSSVSYPGITDPLIFRELLISLDGYRGHGLVVASCLRLLPLLAQRPGQVARMQWEDVYLDEAVWKVSGTARKLKSKAAKQAAPIFVVPLPRQAVDILRDLQDYTGASKGHVFLGNRPGRPISNNTLNTALRSLGWKTRHDDDCERARVHCAHGFRTSFLTLTQDFFGVVAGIAADRHLGHAPKIFGAASQLGDTYNRSTLLSERTALVQRWADALDELKTQGVVPIPPVQVPIPANAPLQYAAA